MSLINRNIEQKNNKILKVLDITKVDGEISELDVVEFRNEGKVYSEGTPLEANCLNNVIQEIIDNALQQRNNADYNNLSFTEEITAEVPLPVKGENGSKLSWSVTKGTAITISNNVMSVVRGNQDEECKLLVTCTLGKFITSKEFDVKVLAREMTDLEKVNEELNEISLPSEVTSDFDLPLVGSNGSSIVWSVTSGTGITISSSTASVTRELYEQTVELKAEVTNGTQTVTRYYDVTILAREMTDLEKVRADLNEISLPSEVTSDFDLPLVGSNGSSIVWSVTSGTGITISSSTASVTRELYEQTVELKAEVTKGTQTVTRYYDVTILAREMTREEVVDFDLESLEIEEDVYGNFDLPQYGENGSTFEWESANEDFIVITGNTAVVTRTLVDTMVELRVTATYNGYSKYQFFMLFVKAREMTDLEKVRADLNEISLPSEVTSDFDLPSVGSNGSSISWSKVSGTGITITSNIAIVTRADYNQTVVLKATVTKGSATITKTFNITIPKYEMSSTEKVALDLASINIPSEVTSSFSLPSYGENDSSFEWTSLNEDYIQIVNYTAVVTRSNVDKYVEIGVKATYQNFYDTRYFTIKVLGTGVSDLEKAQQALNNILLVSSTDKDITLPTTGLNGSTISWAIKSGYGVSISENTLKVAKYLTDRTIVLTATVTYGSSSVSGDFNIIIEKMTDLEVVYNDISYIDVPSQVSDNFLLTTYGDLGSTIEWDSADRSVINIVDGEMIVTRGEGDQTIPISATITYGTATITEYYTVKVLGL